MSIERDHLYLHLAETYGTPIYVYDRCRLITQSTELRAAFAAEQFHLLFATMANDDAAVLRAVFEAGVGACVNSIPHLDLALACGVPAERVQFTSSGVTESDMRTLIARSIRVNLDSLNQAKKWYGLGGRPAGLRINAASLKRSSGIGRADRIGIHIDDLSAAMNIAADHASHVEGLHVYLGTNFAQPDGMLPTLEALFKAASTVPTLTYVNIGGGIGVNYAKTTTPFDILRFGAAVSHMSNSLSKTMGRPVQLLFEPGRGLAAAAGVFMTRVSDVKRLHDKTFVAVDGSIAVFPRPMLHPESPHHVRVVARDALDRKEAQTDVVIVGRTTFSRDILANCRMPQPAIGDVLLFEDAGAYCYSMRSRFLGQPQTESFMIYEEEGRAVHHSDSPGLRYSSTSWPAALSSADDSERVVGSH